MNDDVISQQEIIVAGDEVRAMLETVGWKEYVLPLLDKMITDVLGGKENGRWHNGSLDLPGKSEERLRELQMYKAALVNFHDAVYTMVEDVEGAKKNISEIQSQMSFEESPYENA